MDILQEVLSGQTGSSIAYVLVLCSALGYMKFVGPAIKENEKLRKENDRLNAKIEEYSKTLNDYVVGADLAERFRQLESKLLGNEKFDEVLSNVRIMEESIAEIVEGINRELQSTAGMRKEDHEKLARQLEALLNSFNEDHQQTLALLNTLSKTIDHILNTTSDLRDKQSTLTGAMLGANGLHEPKRLK